MTAVILPFIRPAAPVASPGGAHRPVPRIDAREHLEAVHWADRLGACWSVAWAVGKHDVALSIHTPRCMTAPPGEEEAVSPWIIARTRQGVVALENGWLEQGTYSTVTAALARVLEVEARITGVAAPAMA